jgi:molybdopterin converting factor small subunit
VGGVSLDRGERGDDCRRTVNLRILFFSVLRDIVGAAEISFDLPEGEGSDVAAMLAALYSRWPGLEEWDERIRVAVDLDYVDRSHPVSEGQEIAVMPPVQGG